MSIDFLTNVELLGHLVGLLMVFLYRDAFFEIFRVSKGETLKLRLEACRNEFIFFVLGLIMLVGGIQSVTLGIAGLFLVTYSQLLPVLDEEGQSDTLSSRQKVLMSGVVMLCLSAVWLIYLFSMI